MSKVEQVCEKTGLFIGCEFLAKNLQEICDNDFTALFSLNSENDLNEFLEPFQIYISLIKSTQPENEDPFINYSNGLSGINPLPIPAIYGNSQEVENLKNYLNISQDLILELINVAHLRRESYMGSDIPSIIALLYEILMYNYFKILHIILNFQLKQRDQMLKNSLNVFLTEIESLKNIMLTDSTFISFYDKMSKLNNCTLVTEFIIPISRRHIPLKSTTNFSSAEEIIYFLFEYNKIVNQQQIQLHNILIYISNNVNSKLKLIHFLLSKYTIFFNQSPNCYNLSDIWDSPFICNIHIFSQFSSTYEPLSFYSPEMLFFTTFECISIISMDFSNLENSDTLFDVSFNIFLISTNYLNELQSQIIDSISKPARTTNSFPSLLFLSVIIKAQKYIDGANLSLEQKTRMNSISVDKLIHALIENGAMIWLRRILVQNQDKLDFIIISLIHDIIIDFITGFNSIISSWFRQLSEDAFSNYVIYICNLLLLVCDFYGGKSVKMYLSDKNIAMDYFSFFDLDHVSINIPSTDTQSPSTIAILNFILKLFAATTKPYMIPVCLAALCGLSSSASTSLIIGNLLEPTVFQNMLLNINQAVAVEATSYINWSQLIRFITETTAVEAGITRVNNKIVNKTVSFLSARLVCAIFANSTEFIEEICLHRNFDFVTSCLKFLLSDGNSVIKSTIYMIFTQVAKSPIVAAHTLSLLDQYDFCEESLKIREIVPPSNEFIQHSRICSALRLSSQKDTHFTVLYFTKFIKRILTFADSPSSSYHFKPSKVLIIYLYFMLTDIFPDIATKPTPSEYFRWKCTLVCVGIFSKIFKTFTNIPTFSNLQFSNDGFSVPKHSLTLHDTIHAMGISLFTSFYQNSTCLRSLLDYLKKSLSVNTRSLSKLSFILSSNISTLLAFVCQLVCFDSTLINLPSQHNSILLSPVSHTIGSFKSWPNDKPLVFDLLQILLLDSLSPDIIDTFSTVFTTCCQIPSLSIAISISLCNKSPISLKILQKLSFSLDHDLFVGIKSTPLLCSYANFLIALYEENLFDIFEILLFGSCFESELSSSDQWSSHLQNNCHLAFPSIIKSLYKSDLIYEAHQSLQLHERLFCLIALIVSSPKYRKIILPVLKNLHKRDFIFYVLNLLNTRLCFIRDLMSSSTDSTVFLLRLIASSIYIASIDLAETISNNDTSRVEQLLDLLISNAINGSSIIVQLAKHTVSLPEFPPKYDFRHDSTFNYSFVSNLISNNMVSIKVIPKSLMKLSFRITDTKRCSTQMSEYLLSSYKNESDLTPFLVEKNNIIGWMKLNNTYEIKSLSKYFLLDSIHFCLTTLLLTRSPILRALYNSDNELLFIVKHIIDHTFANLSSLNPDLISPQLNIFSTILCLNTNEAYLSISFNSPAALSLPQNLLVILNQLLDYRSNPEFNSLLSDNIKTCFYKSILYIKITADKMFKFAYLINTHNDDARIKKTYRQISIRLLVRLTSDPLFSFLLDDFLSSSISLQISCLEIIYVITKTENDEINAKVVSELELAEFFDSAPQLLLKLTPRYLSMISGQIEMDENTVRCIEMILIIFSSISSSTEGIHILFRINFVNLINDSNLLEYPINLLGDFIATNRPVNDMRLISFQRIFSATIEILSNSIRILSSMQEDFILINVQVFLKHTHSFKSILESISAVSISFLESKLSSQILTLIRILSSTLKFCSDLGCIRNKILSNAYHPFNSTSNLNLSQIDNLRDMFEPISAIFSNFADSKYLTTLMSILYKNLSSNNKNFSRNVIDSETEKFDPPQMNFQTLQTFECISRVVLYLVRFYQHYIVMVPASDNPTLTELVFNQDSSHAWDQSVIYSHFKESTLSSVQRPAFKNILNVLEAVVEWQSFTNKTLRLIDTCKGSTEYSTELYNSTALYSKWSDLVATLSQPKQSQFYQIRLKNLHSKYQSFSTFLHTLVERCLLLVAVHANFFQMRFFDKIASIRSTQRLPMMKTLDDLLQFLSTKDTEAKMLSEFASCLKSTFNMEFNKKLGDYDFKGDDSSFTFSILAYLESYLSNAV